MRYHNLYLAIIIGSILALGVQIVQSHKIYESQSAVTYSLDYLERNQ